MKTSRSIRVILGRLAAAALVILTFAASVGCSAKQNAKEDLPQSAQSHNATEPDYTEEQNDTEESGDFDLNGAWICVDRPTEYDPDCVTAPNQNLETIFITAIQDFDAQGWDAAFFYFYKEPFATERAVELSANNPGTRVPYSGGISTVRIDPYENGFWGA